MSTIKDLIKLVSYYYLNSCLLINYNINFTISSKYKKIKYALLL